MYCFYDTFQQTLHYIPGTDFQAVLMLVKIKLATTPSIPIGVVDLTDMFSTSSVTSVTNYSIDTNAAQVTVPR
jgi:hypothetical protein